MIDENNNITIELKQETPDEIIERLNQSNMRMSMEIDRLEIENKELKILCKESRDLINFYFTDYFRPTGLMYKKTKYVLDKLERLIKNEL